jgi:hypothetical protein
LKSCLSEPPALGKKPSEAEHAALIKCLKAQNSSLTGDQIDAAMGQMRNGPPPKKSPRSRSRSAVNAADRDQFKRIYDMFLKYLAIMAASGALLMPMSSYAQQAPQPVPQAAPHGGGPGMELLIPIAVLVVVAGALAHGR